MPAGRRTLTNRFGKRRCGSQPHLLPREARFCACHSETWVPRPMPPVAPKSQNDKCKNLVNKALSSLRVYYADLHKPVSAQENRLKPGCPTARSSGRQCVESAGVSLCWDGSNAVGTGIRPDGVAAGRQQAHPACCGWDATLASGPVHACARADRPTLRYSLRPAMFTIHLTPNLSLTAPKVSPHGAATSGWTIVPSAASFSK